MAESELYQKGAAMRRRLMGDAAVERSAREIYSDPVMKKFIEVATETVFRRALDAARPRSKDAGVDLRDLGCGDRAGARTRIASAHGPAPGLVRGGVD